MAEFSENIDILTTTTEADKVEVIKSIIYLAEAAGYTIADVDSKRPWGGFVRFEVIDGDKFIAEFFPNIDPIAARLGRPGVELSPKILLVEPGQRLSWQLHNRRAERWLFLTQGAYHKSSDPDVMGDPVFAEPGHEVQFASGECHRLVGGDDSVTLVAEIWQHTDPEQHSDENDIVRLQDDYKR